MGVIQKKTSLGTFQAFQDQPRNKRCDWGLTCWAAWCRSRHCWGPDEAPGRLMSSGIASSTNQGFSHGLHHLYIYILIINLLLPILIRISMEHNIMLENPDLKTKRWTRVSHGITAGILNAFWGWYCGDLPHEFMIDSRPMFIFSATEQNRQSLWDTETPSEKQTVSRTVTAWKKAIDFVGQRLAHPVFQWIGGEFPSISLQPTLCDVDGYRFLFGKDWIFASSKAKFHPTSQSCGRPCNATFQPFINPTNIGV